MTSKIARTTHVWLTVLTLALLARLDTRPRADNPDDRDRGDVPGWVMITVMTVSV